MPRVVRLPAHVRKDEVRVYWDRTDEGDDLHVFGPGSIRRFALSIFDGRSIRFKNIGDQMMADASGQIVHDDSPLKVLEDAGWDLRTLVFSIRRKDRAPVDEVVPDDLRKRLDEAQEALRGLSAALDAAAETKDVFVLDQAEMDAIREARSQADDAVASVIDALDAAPA